MNIICVDDEVLALQNFTFIMQNILPEQKVHAFTDGDKAIEYFKNEKIDIAFLDINMRPNGIEMGHRLKKMNPDVKLVFITAYNNYAFEAFQLDVVDYLLKPYDQAQVKHTLIKLGAIDESKRKKRIYFCTMPCFGLFINDERVLMRGSRIKEVLAYLVSVEGREVSNRELLENVWGVDEIDEGALVLVRVTIKNLHEKLKENCIEDILIMDYGVYCLDMRKFSSDLQELRNGNKHVINAYDGRFLEEYSWAEEINARIAQLVNWDWE